MQLSGPTSQPIGHYEFCQRYASECERNTQVGFVKLTQAAWKQIVDVNKVVNSSIFPRTDQEIYGKAEYWEYPKVEGDCEDFALLKQYMLEKAGYPRSALLITVARQPNGDGHAVLTVRTDRGDFILDNLDERVLDWKDSDLRFLKRQSERHAGKWLGVDDDRDMLVGSVK
ncbi:transglutaminase-like cysteine peptidase [Aureimonas leprariae]|uniref:Transglutaminase-like cysteine peptidase n=1 Tax=Plantimonas leprariae TaxID=2615207 RepID=A0A7V7PR50_9HYPH|nr:transglutaminase-like cysteine peptidase [Aureimonas leprariae]KAB0680950.1 transglutaminase-like cysteine peptidase [Aureimonas leprariae]